MAQWGVSILNSIRDKTAAIAPPPFVSHLKLDQSLRIDEIEDGRVVQSWTPAAHFGMPDGIVQGGLFCSIADMSQAFALLTTQNAIENWATLDFHVRFLRLARIGEVVRIESEVVNKTESKALVETSFVSDDGKLLARVTGGWTKSSRERAWGVS